MSIRFEDLKDVFKQNLIWEGPYEMCWYEIAWEALRKENLLEEHSSFEFSLAQLRSFTLIMLYSEFCQLQFQEVCFYDFYNSLGYSDVSDFDLALMAGMLLDDDVVKEHLQSNDYNQILIDVADTMRDEVLNALVKHMGEGSESLLYASMVATNWQDIELDDEFDMDNEIESDLIESGSPDDVCEKYKQIINIYGEDILSADDFNSAEAFNWLSSGTYRLEEY
ncbi:MAG: hypothetical protein RBR71_07310 [Gudongella sp.]|nr:hypothetical protein [Gudongella sp.]